MMKQARRWGSIFGVLILVVGTGSSFAQSKANTLTCVGLYSETSLGSVSYRAGSGNWIVIKAGDVIPADAQIRVNVPQDWIELTPSNDQTSVYKIEGRDSGDVVEAVAEILKGSPKKVSFPNSSGGSPDPKFANKVVVLQYNSRHVYRVPGQPGRNIQYGDVLDASGRVSIIAINTTIDLMKADGTVFQVIGPLTFSVAKAMAGQQIYKYLNAP